MSARSIFAVFFIKRIKSEHGPRRTPFLLAPFSYNMRYMVPYSRIVMAKKGTGPPNMHVKSRIESQMKVGIGEILFLS